MPPLRSRSRVNRVLQRCAAPVAASPHISVTKNGAGFRGGDLTSPQIFGYRCSAGTSLTLTQGGLSQVWVSS